MGLVSQHKKPSYLQNFAKKAARAINQNVSLLNLASLKGFFYLLSALLLLWSKPLQAHLFFCFWAALSSSRPRFLSLWRKKCFLFLNCDHLPWTSHELWPAWQGQKAATSGKLVFTWSQQRKLESVTFLGRVAEGISLSLSALSGHWERGSFRFLFFPRGKEEEEE